MGGQNEGCGRNNDAPARLRRPPCRSGSPPETQPLRGPGPPYPPEIGARILWPPGQYRKQGPREPFLFARALSVFLSLWPKIFGHEFRGLGGRCPPRSANSPVTPSSQKGCKFPCLSFPQRFPQSVENSADFSTITGCILPKTRISVENSVESVENPIFWGGFFHTGFHENCRSITFC